jgi:hypothetical protein
LLPGEELIYVKTLLDLGQLLHCRKLIFPLLKRNLLLLDLKIPHRPLLTCVLGIRDTLAD